MNAEPEDEVREAITDELRAALAPALRGVRTELCPMQTDEDEARMVVELGRYMRIAGGGWPAEQRAEWIEGAAEELGEYPLELVADAIGRARKRVRYPGEFVPWVVNDIEPAVDKLRIEEQRMTRLMEIAAT